MGVLSMNKGSYQLRRDVDRLQHKYRDISASMIGYEELIKATEEYKRTSDTAYTLFRGDCWTINNNFESSAAVTSQTHNDLTVTGTFRTENDMIGLYWNSQDLITHPYISYGSRTDYSDVILQFDYSMTGCMDFTNNAISITIRTKLGETFYLKMNRFINNGHFYLDFNNLSILAGDQYIDRYGQTITVDTETPVSPKNIESIMFVIVPTNYVENNTQYTIMENAQFTCTISNINVFNGYICNEHIDLDPHKYRLCEGYDDFYNLNPKRVVREMRKLGYVEWLDLYIGASHFYEKSGTPGDVITDLSFNHNRTEKMVLSQTIYLNNAFAAWLDCYSRELKANGTNNLIISVSMENLQCPKSWRQKTADGRYALTGWIPSTFFYSPCHTEPITYMKKVSEACLDIIVANGLPPILQMGEAWWWWQESDKTNRPPCFYDDATKTKYLAEFGKEIPLYYSSKEAYDKPTIRWLNKQLVDYSAQLRSVVKDTNYINGIYMALFFPPSVTDTDRVPPMMREVNYLKDAYSPNQLDILQLEDYDWVIEDSPHHDEVYGLGQELGFTLDKLHYYGGFVQYPEDAIEYWILIKKAMDVAINMGFAETYVWAGSQVRRDWKILGYDKYELVQGLMFV